MFFFYFDNTFRDSDSASSTFVQCLNRRVSTATADINLLESMSLDTVSFEELLGHCYQIFNNNQTHLLHLKNHLKPLGYLPFEIENDEEEEEVLDSNDRCFSVTNSAIKSLDEDPLLLDESMSLKNFGLSDVCLATLASQASVYIKMKKPNAAIRDANATLESSYREYLKLKARYEELQ